MGKRRIQLGQAGERLIDAVLRKQHYTIVARNFVEVRTRRGSQSISPEQGLSFRKRERMEKVARIYLGQHADDADIAWHLSFAAVVVNHTGSIDRITLYPDMDGEPLELK